MYLPNDQIPKVGGLVSPASCPLQRTCATIALFVSTWLHDRPSLRPEWTVSGPAGIDFKEDPIPLNALVGRQQPEEWVSSEHFYEIDGDTKIKRAA